MMLYEWARAWAISDDALRDLHARLGALDPSVPPDPGASEAAVQTRVRLKASKQGWALWRNNVGAVHDDARGVHVRYGLCNDSPGVNAVIKSADLIGIRPMIVQPCDVGKLIGQFVSIECKRAGWQFGGSDRETAQLNWANRVNALGGDARFLANEKDL